MFNRKLKERLQEAENIIVGYEIMLNHAHLSENKGAACEFARKGIQDYFSKWRPHHE